MSTLKVDTIQGKTTAGNIIIPNHVIQIVYNTPASGQTMTDVSSQSSITINNSTTRGTATCSVTRKDANSFFIINIGCTMARASTSGELRIGYRIGSGSDNVAYFQDNTSWVRGHGEFKDTTTGSVGDVLSFESVFTTTEAQNSYIRHISMSVMEIAQ
tara:strand:- start:99 stop:572 length:474 start_codon:yes stop_codon:yes gene_type:complete